MTFRNAPLAIDGARIDSALLRVLSHSAVEEGVGRGDHLKVTANGTGLRVAGGIGNVLNRYKEDPDEMYITSNLGEALIGASQMPPANAAQRSHLVVLTVGDPEFDQAQHPWMLVTDPPEGTEVEFEYVRLHVIQDVPSTTQHFSELNLNFPALTLARLGVPPNTTTYTDAMLVDLRELPEPRDKEVIESFTGASENNLNGQGGTPGAWEGWPNVAFLDVAVPIWATEVKILGFVEGAIKTKAGAGKLRVSFVDGGSTTVTNISEDATGSRVTYNVGGKISIPEAYRGTTRRIRMEGTPNNESSKGFLKTQNSTSALLRLRFEEGLQ